MPQALRELSAFDALYGMLFVMVCGKAALLALAAAVTNWGPRSTRFDLFATVVGILEVIAFGGVSALFTICVVIRHLGGYE